MRNEFSFAWTLLVEDEFVRRCWNMIEVFFLDLKVFRIL